MNTVDISTAVHLRARVGRFAHFIQIFCQQSLQTIRNRQKARRTQWAVSHLNDHLLQDIGLNRGDIVNPLLQVNQGGLLQQFLKSWRQANEAFKEPGETSEVINPAAANDSPVVNDELPRAA